MTAKQRAMMARSNGEAIRENAVAAERAGLGAVAARRHELADKCFARADEYEREADAARAAGGTP